LAVSAHAYPPDLARVVRERWVETANAEQEASARDTSALPSSEVLERMLSVCVFVPDVGTGCKRAQAA
jgi:hypothetical protein